MFSEKFHAFSREKLESRRGLLDASIWESIEREAGELHTALAFLYGTLPLPDTKAVSFESMRREAQVVLDNRRSDTPEDIFANYVLCPRVNNETLEPSRDFFSGQLRNRIQGLSTMETVLEVNRWCCEQVSYQASDNRTEGPLTAYKSGKGRCGEESTFAVYALRSVGIPARQVYAPWWSHCDDNHAWVEVYVEGSWHFLGACEPEPVLDKGWFLGASARAMLVHGRAFSSYRAHAMEQEEVIEEREGAYLYNVTHRYAPVTKLSIKVNFSNGTPAIGAIIDCQMLNMGDWRTIARLTTDAGGRATLTCGKGSLHLACAFGELYGEKNVHTGEEKCVTLTLGQQEGGGEFIPPETGAVTPPAISREAEEENRAFLLSAALHRSARQRQYYREALRGREIPADWTQYIKTACGNGQEIASYLEEGTKLFGNWAVKMLDTLPEKDLRDTPATTLLAFLKRGMEHLPAYTGREKLFADYVLCPRVGLEKIGGAFGEKEAVIAKLRSIGVAARLNPFTGEPEVGEENGFVPLDKKPRGTLTVTGEGSWAFGQNWSLAQKTKLGFMSLHNGLTGQPMELPVGDYRLMSLVRLPSGKQRYFCQHFTLQTGEEKTVHLVRPAVSTKDMLVDVAVPEVTLYKESTAISLAALTQKPTLLLFLQPGGEPTAHILNELMEEGEELMEKLQPIAALPASCTEEETFRKFFTRYPKTPVCVDRDSGQEPMARALFLEPGDYPLLFLMNKGRCRFARSGYAVGTVELLKRLTECL